MFIKDKFWGVVEGRDNGSLVILDFIGGISQMLCKINNLRNRVISILFRIMDVIV